MTDAVSSGAQKAATGITAVAIKAKVPLVASGAALAGVATTAVVATRSGKRRKVLGISMPQRNALKMDAKKITEAVTDAAQRADEFGQRVSKVANSVENVSEAAGKAAKRS